MDWVGIIVAGLVATAVFTMLIYGAPMMGMPKMDIARMLGSMVLPQGSTAFAAGMMMHFINGIIFAIIYALVWNALNIAPSWWTGLIFGAVHFVVAAVGMTLMASMHKEIKAGRMASPVAGGMKSVAGMLVGHLVFGVVLGLVYGAFV